MIPNDEPLRTQTIERMVNSLIENFQTGEKEFTKWEQEFLISLDAYVKDGRRLSTKQTEILERLYDK